MALEVYYDVAGKRIAAKVPEYLPRPGDVVVLTPFGRVRSVRHVVQQVEWHVAQEESAAYFNRPKTCVIRLAVAQDADTGGEVEG